MQDRCITNWDNLPPAARQSVLTIGNFDGVHLGHQRILSTSRSLADTDDCSMVAMTFEPPPDLVLRPGDIPQRITPRQAKCEYILKGGADYVVVVEATRELFSMTPDEFIAEVVLARFAPRHVVEGQNFFFGRGRSGNVETLSEAGKKCGFVTHVVEPYMIELDGESQRVSSTLIRKLIADGRVRDATRCLGRNFTLYGKVISGHGHGRLLEFPTANLKPDQQIVPADGVYAGKAKIDGEEFVAAISVGEKPTLGPANQTIEAFLLDASGDYYDKYMELSFVEHLRGQERFENMQKLQQQIKKDVEHVRKIVG